MIIKFSEEKKKGKLNNLIPVHINLMRCNSFFWNWSKENNDWIRGNKIPQNLKKMYKNPLLKSNY